MHLYGDITLHRNVLHSNIVTFDSPSTLKQHYLSLVTILFAATYNHRTNTGDNTVESAWTIVKLSPTLSWFEHPRSIVDAASMVTRRALCFPLYRSWTLATRCLRDVVTLLHLGKPAVVKVLLDAMDIVEHCEDAWRVGKVWLEDYARWMQFEEREGGASEEYLQAMAKELERIVEEMEQNGGCDCHGAALCKRDVTFGAWNIQTLEELAMEDAMDGDDDDEQSASSSSITTSSESESDSTASDTMSDTTSSDNDSDDEDYDFTYRPELPVLPARRAFASTPTRRSPLIQVISSEDLQCGGSDSKDEGNTDDDHYMLQ